MKIELLWSFQLTFRLQELRNLRKNNRRNWTVDNWPPRSKPSWAQPQNYDNSKWNEWAIIINWTKMSSSIRWAERDARDAVYQVKQQNLLLDEISRWHWAVSRLQLAVWQAWALLWSKPILAVSIMRSTTTLSSHQEVEKELVGIKRPSWNRNSANITVLPDVGSTKTLFYKSEQKS